MDSTELLNEGPAGIRDRLDRPRPTSHYQLLGVDRLANSIEIRQAYFRLKSVYISGNQALYSLINEDELAAMVGRIEYAFAVLHNPSSRQAYDRELDFSLETPPLKRAEARQISEEAEQLPSLPIQQVRAGTEGASKSASIVSKNVESNQQAEMPAQPSVGVPKMPSLRSVASNVSRDEVRAKVDGLVIGTTKVDGLFFRSLREAVGVSEEEMHLNTKVSLRFIQSLENDRIDEMPAATYAKGFVKSYLRYLGIKEPRELIESYFQRGKSCNPQATL